MATSASVVGTQRVKQQAQVAAERRYLYIVAALLISVASTAFVVGTAWDIQWHVQVGRDRVFTAPHVMMLAGIVIAGLTSLTVVLADSWQTYRRGVLAPLQRRIFGLFRAPIGFVVAGSGALLSAIAFPLDDYWHTLYGIDVTLWAPFHVMIIMGMVMVGLGTLAVLAAEIGRAGESRRLTHQISFAIVLATTFATLLLLLPQADASEGLVSIGTYQFVLYPVLLAFALPLALLLAVRVTGLAGAATLTALVFVGLRSLMFAFVPWAVEATVAAEGLAYRSTEPIVVIAPFAFPTSILLSGLVLDLLVWRTRKRADQIRLVLVATLGAAVASAFWDRPWATTLPAYYYPTLDVSAVLVNALPFVTVSALLGLGLAWFISEALNTIRSEGAHHA
jgi:hypothetical protein